MGVARFTVDLKATPPEMNEIDFLSKNINFITAALPAGVKIALKYREDDCYSFDISHECFIDDSEIVISWRTRPHKKGKKIINECMPYKVSLVNPNGNEY